MTLKRIILLSLSLLLACGLSAQDAVVRPGDTRLGDYLPLLHGRRVGVLTNHTGVVDG